MNVRVHICAAGVHVARTLVRALYVLLWVVYVVLHWAFFVYLWTGMAKATHGDNVCHSFSALSAGAPVPSHTSSPASGISPCACDHTGLWACLESCGL